MNRRDLLRSAGLAAAALTLRAPLAACSREQAADGRRRGGPDQERLARWSESLRAEGLVPPDALLGRAAARVGELAAGTPYEAHTLEAYLRDRGEPAATEPLTLSLTPLRLRDAGRGVPGGGARVARGGARRPGSASGARWSGCATAAACAADYASRLHYFSEWIADGARRGLLRDLGPELGGVEDERPLRFMTEHRAQLPRAGRRRASSARSARWSAGWTTARAT